MKASIMIAPSASTVSTVLLMKRNASCSLLVLLHLSKAKTKLPQLPWLSCCFHFVLTRAMSSTYIGLLYFVPTSLRFPRRVTFTGRFHFHFHWPFFIFRVGSPDCFFKCYMLMSHLSSRSARSPLYKSTSSKKKTLY